MVICAGSGGVGKTTVSAGLGLRAAELGLRVLVLTVDPAQRLMTSLGLEMGSDLVKEVPVTGVPGKLYAGIVQSKKIFDDFIKTHAGQPEIIERIFANRLYQQLSTTLSGSQEFTALEKLLFEYESGRFDLIVLDTPPTKHALDFFLAPRRIDNLFQDSITKWFILPDKAPKGFMANLFYKGTRTVFKSLEVLTGSQFIEELIDFFAAIQSIQQVLRERSQKMQKLLAGEQTRFILITSFDAAKLSEAMNLQNQFKSMGYGLDAVIINRAFPNWMPQQGDTMTSDANSDTGKLLAYYKKFRNYYALRYSLYEGFAAQIKSGIALLRIPEYAGDICGLDDLKVLSAFFASPAEPKAK